MDKNTLERMIKHQSSCVKLFHSKYSNAQLLSMEEKFCQFQLKRDLLPWIINNEDDQVKCLNFLGKMKIQVITAQQIINQIQNQGKVLIFDMRSMNDYHTSHFEHSINFPIDKCCQDFFLNWDPKIVMDEIIKNQEKKALFCNRRRLFIHIIASSNDINFFLQKLPRLFNIEAIKQYSDKYQEAQPHRLDNLVSLRNAILLYKALKNERIREISLSVNGFNTFKEKYPYFCKFRTSYLYPRNHISPTYPCEILEGRLYLGDHIHAQDKTILKNLKITHILNVTNNIPNYFEHDSNLSIDYLKIDIADKSDVPIKLSFPLAYKYIEDAFTETILTKNQFKSLRSHALIDHQVSSEKVIINKRKSSLNSTALVAPIDVDFIDGKTDRHPKQNELNAYQIDTLVDQFNRVAYNHNVVLVHCAMGVSRSASCVIMYIMKKFQMSFNDALEFVQSRRSVVDPNEGFVAQLKEFENNKCMFSSGFEKEQNEHDKESLVILNPPEQFEIPKNTRGYTEDDAEFEDVTLA